MGKNGYRVHLNLASRKCYETHGNMRNRYERGLLVVLRFRLQLRGKSLSSQAAVNRKFNPMQANPEPAPYIPP